MMDKTTKYHRHSIRLKEYDYTLEGAYFITIVAKKQKCIFGKTNKNDVQLSEFGIIVQECWQDLPNHFSNVTIEPYVLMPNHIHGVITILDNCRGTIYRAPTEEAFGHPTVGSVPTLVRAYKAEVSRIAKNSLGFTYIWQRNYYDHIIRNEHEYRMIWDYIDANPTNFQCDQSDYLPSFLLHSNDHARKQP